MNQNCRMKEHCRDFYFENSVTNRSRGKFNEHQNSNFVAVRVEFANVSNLSKFIEEMKTQIEQRTNTESMREISINECKVSKNTLH